MKQLAAQINMYQAKVKYLYNYSQTNSNMTFRKHKKKFNK